MFIFLVYLLVVVTVISSEVLALQSQSQSQRLHVTTGFIHVNITNKEKNTKKSFYIQDLYNVPVTADVLELNGVPSYVNMPSKTFTIVPGKKSNNKNVYSNGKYFLFFVNNVKPFGTWLVGDRIGVDSGVAYMRPEVHSLVPVDIETANAKWNCLKDGKWIVENEMEMVVVEEFDVKRVQYHSISYFSDRKMSESVILSSPLQEIEEERFQFLPSLSAPLPDPASSMKYPVYWNVQSNQWTPFVVSFSIPIGSPVRLIESSSDDQSDDNVAYTNKIVHLVGHESSDNGWRLFLREADKDGGAELEIMITLTNSGLDSKYNIKSLNKLNRKTHVKKINKKVMGFDIGTFSWIFFHAEPGTIGENKYLAVTTGDFVLKCVGKSLKQRKEKYLFEYHHSHRRVAMDRSVLSYTTSLVSAEWNPDINSLEWFLDGSPLIIDALFALDPDPVTWLRNYLIAHEGYLSPGLSSCFMYHGGLSMPQQLIYAAEMVCVLIGSKPMTMVRMVFASLVFSILICVYICAKLCRFNILLLQIISGNFLL